MKKIIAIACLAAFAACSQNETKKDATTTTVAATDSPATKLDYPYTIDKMPDWEIGDPKNAQLALKALRAYELGNMDESASYFGDTIRFYGDRYEEKLTNDSLKAMFNAQKIAGDVNKIKMEDWESVRSKDGKDEWVSLWYQQITTTKAGKVDSVSVMNDLKFVNGKIVLLDEKLRHYAAKKK
ncbi:MAG: hypothetical protein JWQ27_1338 [Ferruginibacter sp.]|nr:hypothetical protein [Ferruginibacter sp.]